VAGTRRTDLFAAGQWARSNGHDVSDRIPAAVLEAHDAAH
jgi:hypothetical protein